MIKSLCVLVVRLARVRALRWGLRVIFPIVAVVVTYYLCFLLRFDGRIPASFLAQYWHTLPILLIVSVLIFMVFKMHAGMWSYFSVDDLVRMVASEFTAVALFGVIIYASKGWSFEKFPRSILPLEFILLVGWTSGARLFARYIREFAQRSSQSPTEGNHRILVAGDLPNVDLLLRGVRGQSIGQLVGIVSDDKSYENQVLQGLKVHCAAPGSIGRIAERTRANCILLLPPFNRPRDINEVVSSCSEAGVSCEFRTIPSLFSLASGAMMTSSIRKVDIEDLLPRESANLDRTEVRRFIKGKKVMITGAGGSIGSELCRQIASYEPETVVLFEFSEFALYTIEQDLRLRYPNLHIVPVAGDIRHSEEIRSAIRRHDGIDIIYHAAAYKHVPLMELNVPACFRTNVLGTARLAQVAVEERVERVVMISSDKAVCPTSIMGATKRIAERIVAEMPTDETSFVAVRFGNVLESSGSVIPLFKKLIAEGKPLPVTSSNVRRFFMTIREAVELVLQAGTVGQNGDVMVLEMGESVKIIDFARRLIELSGLVPDKDIKIEIVGLRPGEKEYEEVMTSDENVVRTAYEKIWVLRKDGVVPPVPSPADADQLKRIEGLVLKDQERKLRKLASEYVPENAFSAAEGVPRLLKFEPAPASAAQQSVGS